MTKQAVTVRMGVLTDGEFDRLCPEEQVDVEAETQPRSVPRVIQATR